MRQAARPARDTGGPAAGVVAVACAAHVRGADRAQARPGMPACVLVLAVAVVCGVACGSAPSSAARPGQGPVAAALTVSPNVPKAGEAVLPCKVVPMANGAQGSEGWAGPWPSASGLEAAAFLLTHQWDPHTALWTLKPGVMPPPGLLPREAVLASREAFLSTHRWQDGQGWLVMRHTRRNLAAQTATQRRQDLQHFAQTHRWDERSGHWQTRQTPQTTPTAQRGRAAPPGAEPEP